MSSTARDRHPRSIFLDASADGKDVDIPTHSQLHSDDNDQGNDLYDARIRRHD